jgi:hypothetical protein
MVFVVVVVGKLFVAEWVLDIRLGKNSWAFYIIIIVEMV